MESTNNLKETIKYKCNNILYWFRYRFNPKYWGYWMVKPKTLGIGYHDPDVLMLHSCMHILVDFYEYQLSGAHVDWHYDEEHSDAFNEMKAIYEWWTIERVEIENKINNAYSNETCKYTYDEINNFSINLHFKEQEMLKRLIDIRRFLWD